ncbi:MAG TPA: universal stress protein [Vicinamibacterales bacterium]|nr:universal stress protein [Vicinamibacterales bacterium]
MVRFTHILCPVDGSAFATRALRHAAAFAREYGAALTVLTVRPTMPALGIWAAPNLMLPPVLPDDRERTFAAFQTFAQDTTGLPDVRVLLQDGPVVGEILREAREWPADLIVMGTRGASGFERFILGSVTEKVLRRAAVPVLTIPRDSIEAPDLAFKTVLCAFDRSDASARALDYAVMIARESGARVVLAHIVEQFLNEDPQFARHFDNRDCFRAAEPELRAWYAARVPPEARAACDVELEQRCGKASTELLAIARERQAKLIAVGTASTAAMFGSTAHTIVRSADVPVLVVPPPEEPR